MKRVIVLVALTGFALGCSSPDTVEDDSMTEGMEDYGDDFDMGEEELKAEPVESVEADPVLSVLKAAADGEHRSEANRTRNQYRNPAETLAFFGFDPSLEVIEIWPGGGWYTEILAPALLTGEGSLRTGVYTIKEDDPEDYRTRITTEYMELLDAQQEAFGTVETGILEPPNTVELGEPESADLVVTFRNLHNTYRSGVLDDFLAAVHGALKSGGTFGVVQHRAPEGSDPDETAEQGYLAEAFVIEQVEAAGFVLEESSEINANPLDTADHEHGVWSLPPGLRGGEETAEKYKKIGESDRMTLRFTKQ